MKNEVLLLLGGLAIFAIVLSLFMQIESNKKQDSMNTGKLQILGKGDKNTDVNGPSVTPKQKSPPEMDLKANTDYKAVLKTSEGDITIDLSEDTTKVTVNNFVSLANQGFYNNTIFHRVIKDFMIQGGDPNGDGTGGPGYTFNDENFTGEYTRGTVAMANAGPNTNGSQFFIMHADTPTLPKDYVIFGTVLEGLDVVDKIAEAAVTTSFSGEKSKPVKPVKIKSVKIIEEAKAIPTDTPAPTVAEPTPTTTGDTPTPTPQAAPSP